MLAVHANLIFEGVYAFRQDARTGVLRIRRFFGPPIFDGKDGDMVQKLDKRTASTISTLSHSLSSVACPS